MDIGSGANCRERKEGEGEREGSEWALRRFSSNFFCTSLSASVAERLQSELMHAYPTDGGRKGGTQTPTEEEEEAAVFV